MPAIVKQGETQGGSTIQLLIEVDEPAASDSLRLSVGAESVLDVQYVQRGETAAAEIAIGNSPVMSLKGDGDSTDVEFAGAHLSLARVDLLGDGEVPPGQWDKDVPDVDLSPLEDLAIAQLFHEAEHDLDAMAIPSDSKCKIKCKLKLYECLRMCARIPPPQGKAVCAAACTARYYACIARC